MRSCWLTTAWVLLSATAIPAADLESGPEKGQAMPALKVHDVTGPHAGQDIDAAAERKDKPTVYLFVVADKWDRPMARFLKKLDGEIQKEDDVLAVAVWLSDDPDTAKQYLPQAQQSLRFQKMALTVFPTAKKTPDGWSINLEAGLTIVVASRGKVVESFGFRAPTDTDLPKVQKALTKSHAGK